MEFVNVCLQHVNATVREAAMQLTVDLYRKYNGNIRDLLPVSTSDYIVMKNIFWRTLFQKLDELDEAQGDFMQIESRMDMQTTKLPQVNSKKTLNAGSKDNKRKVTKADQDTFEPTSIDQTCPFCKRNAPDLKSKQQMDEHYLVDCPMLLQCKHCSQVVEIKNITSHYLHDCSNKANMAQCSNCCEVFISTQLESHVKASRCTAPPDDHLKCPLCHNNVNNTDDVIIMTLSSLPYIFYRE
jgi:centrosomal protein CEP104